MGESQGHKSFEVVSKNKRKNLFCYIGVGSDVRIQMCFLYKVVVVGKTIYFCYLNVDVKVTYYLENDH